MTQPCMYFINHTTSHNSPEQMVVENNIINLLPLKETNIKHLFTVMSLKYLSFKTLVSNTKSTSKYERCPANLLQINRKLAPILKHYIR